MTSEAGRASLTNIAAICGHARAGAREHTGNGGAWVRVRIAGRLFVLSLNLVQLGGVVHVGRATRTGKGSAHHRLTLIGVGGVALLGLGEGGALVALELRAGCAARPAGTGAARVAAS